jgi:hypothetical protein
MEATDLLRDLAKKTAHAPEPLGTGPYHYVHTTGSHLRTNRFLRRNGESTVTGAVEKFEREQWTSPDGSGRLVVTGADGKTIPPSGDFAPGQLASLRFNAIDEDALAAELGRLNAQTTTRAAMNSFRQVWNLQVVTPPLQRLLLLHLAKCADLVLEEASRDFAGRSGVAVSHIDRARHQRHLLAFVPETGELIGAEATALEGATVPVPVPAVVSSTEWLCSGYCETTDEPPRRR